VDVIVRFTELPNESWEPLLPYEIALVRESDGESEVLDSAECSLWCTQLSDACDGDETGLASVLEDLREGEISLQFKGTVVDLSTLPWRLVSQTES
jgi:hypothetical protein